MTPELQTAEPQQVETFEPRTSKSLSDLSSRKILGAIDIAKHLHGTAIKLAKELPPRCVTDPAEMLMYSRSYLSKHRSFLSKDYVVLAMSLWAMTSETRAKMLGTTLDPNPFGLFAEESVGQ